MKAPWKLTAATVAGLAVSASLIAAPGDGPGYGYGPGMMGGYGPGLMGGYGPGMMGGYGPGMMGGYGPGMMAGGYGLDALGLSDDQRAKIEGILEESRQRNWVLMGSMHAENFKLRQLYRAERPDPDAISEQQAKIDTMRRGMIRSQVDARNRIEVLLTPEQRRQWRALSPGWMRQPRED